MCRQLTLTLSQNGKRSNRFQIKLLTDKVLYQHPKAKKIKRKVVPGEAAGEDSEAEEGAGGEVGGEDAGEVEGEEEALHVATWTALNRMMENLGRIITQTRRMKVHWATKKTRNS